LLLLLMLLLPTAAALCAHSSDSNIGTAAMARISLRPAAAHEPHKVWGKSSIPVF
jgi:hypothetical protein